MPDRMPEDIPEDIPDRMPEDMPDRMPEDMSDRMPEDLPDRMPEDLPDRMPEDIPEDMPDHMPEDMPDRMPNRMSEDMSGRMPEDLPVRKYINVMVGITRSKVIAFFACEAWHVHKPAHKIGSASLTIPLKIQVGSHPRGQGRIDGSCNTWTFGCARPPGSCRRSGAGRSTDSTLPTAADPY